MTVNVHSRSLLRNCATAAILALSAPVAAQAQEATYSFNIPAQDLAVALRTYAQVSRQQVSFEGDSIRGKVSKPLVGRFTADESLRQLLNGTGLTFKRSSTGVLIIVPASPSSVADVVSTTQGDDSESSAVLEEVIVTATRQSESVNRAPLSITAFTQATLERQGIKNIDDLRRITPGLGLSFGNNSASASTSGDTNISLRGIAAVLGAATTGVYVDDVPIHKTATNGSGFGAPFPKLFDLERVEVLRGPQGTLYGGSTLGGAIRFITPAPSLDDHSGIAKAEASVTKDGDPSFEAGAAFGGPIVPDKLGFRVSVWGRHEGGYIDHVSRFTRAELADDTNNVDAHLLRAALAWSPIEPLRVTAALLYQRESRADTDQFYENSPAINAPAVGFTAAGTNCNLVPVTNCARILPAHTYGPYDMFGPYKNGGSIIDPVTGVETAFKSPRRDVVYLPSLTLDYDFDNFSLKVISGLLSEHVHGHNDLSYKTGAPAQLGINNYPANEVFTFSKFQMNAYMNNRRAISHELRLSSNVEGSRFSWVAGGFYSRSRAHYRQWTYSNIAWEIPVVRGVTHQQFFGFPPLDGILVGTYNSYLRETSLSGFGEANYYLTRKLRLTAGLRVSREKVDITFVSTGVHNRGLFVATTANGGFVNGKLTETPVTPKVSVSYQIDPDSMVYATAAKGYRTGGYNTPAQSANAACRSTLTTLGLPDIPSTYDNDTVWSYEAGAKTSLLDRRAQLNASVYQIDWSDIQTLLSIPNCGQYTANAASARSKGFDIQGVAKFGRLTLSGSVGYTDARYTDALRTPTLAGGSVLVINAGDRIVGVPKWSVNVGLQYDFNIFGGREAYVRADYQYGAGVYRSTGPGTTGYLPDTYKAGSLQYVSAAAGVELNERADLSLFARNLFNSTDRTYLLGGSNATRNSPVLFGQTFRPREIGLKATYRY